MNLVFTSRSLAQCLQLAGDSWYEDYGVPGSGEWNVLAIDDHDTRYILHRDDREISLQRIVLIGEQERLAALHELPPGVRRQALQRAHRAALAAASPPTWLPPDWSSFHEDNLLAFFAASREFGNYRWVMEIAAGDSHDVCFWGLTTEDRQLLLRSFTPDHQSLSMILSKWAAHVDSASLLFEARPKRQDEAALTDTIDLDATSFGALTRHRTYTDWLTHLTPAQRSFVNDTSRSSIKLRGPAGSGKTLTLELRLLRELYEARRESRNIRILFATHSWAMAIQVDEGLRQLDESGDLRNVDVMPLLAIAQATIPAERMSGELRLMGEDSLTGKRAQLQTIAGILRKIRDSDWLAFRSRVSQEFRERVESSNLAEEKALVWDLMNEFASVLSANGILPGINAERKYFAIQRTPWMMPLSNEVEKRFVLHVYDQYVASLKADGVLSSDQLINDFWNYLETFAWNIRREKEGYDIIFVDELHLFSEQERLALNSLTRSPDEYPRMYMALDPRQAPTEVYAGFSAVVRRTDSGEADMELGSYRSVELKRIYRFTPQILELIRHINRSYPSVETLGEDWTLDLDAVDAATQAGPLPKVYRHTDPDSEIDSVCVEAKTLSGEADSGRIAIVLLDPLLLPHFENQLREHSISVTVVASRSDVEQLRYTRRTVVLSAAEYVGGLQFDNVICAGFMNTTVGVAHSGHQRRRFLSLLYLSLTRAVRAVSIHVNDMTGGVPDVLASALANHVAVLS